MTKITSEPVHMKVTNKQPKRFYVRSAISFLKGQGDDKPATELLTISALGNAINVAIACAAQLESNKLGKVEAVKTDYINMVEGSSKSCPHIEVRIARLPQDDDNN